MPDSDITIRWEAAKIKAKTEERFADMDLLIQMLLGPQGLWLQAARDWVAGSRGPATWLDSIERLTFLDIYDDVRKHERFQEMLPLLQATRRAARCARPDGATMLVALLHLKLDTHLS